jgi:CheY-like chemotaxis protein
VVLVVDDDLEFLREIRGVLAPLADRVLVAQAPLAGLWHLDRDPIDLVLCDLALFGSDGRHFLEVVRRSWPSVTRVLITGFGDRIARDPQPTGAQAVVLKPFGLGDLIEALGGALFTRSSES